MTSASRCSTPSPSTTSAQLLERAKAWTQAKADARLPRHRRSRRRRRARLPAPLRLSLRPSRAPVRPPASHETHSVTTRLIAPTIQQWGTPSPAGRARPPLPRRPRAVLPAVLRARRRLRPRQPLVPRRARRRRVGRQRPEGVELGRPVLRVGRADRPHRRRRPEAPRHDGVHHPDGPARHRGPPDPPDERRGLVQRGVLHRRARPRLDAARRGGRRLAGGPDDARLRARPLRRLGRQPRGRRVAAARWRRRGRWASPPTRRPAVLLTDAYIGDRVETFVNRRAAELARAARPGRRARSASCCGRRGCGARRTSSRGSSGRR